MNPGGGGRPDPGEWVMRACAPEESPWCCVDQGMVMATDGRRLHLAPSTAPSGWYDAAGGELPAAVWEGVYERLVDRLACLFSIDPPVRNFSDMPMGVVQLESGLDRGWPLPPAAQPRWDDPVAVASKDLNVALAGLGPRVGEPLYLGYNEVMDRTQAQGIRLLDPGTGREALLPVYPAIEPDHDDAWGRKRR